MTKFTQRIACIITVLFAFSVFFQMDNKASAGNFETLAATGFLSLSMDEKWEQSYKTSLGDFKIRFRKLAFSSEQKRYHLIIWWNGKRIADGYSPENGAGYAFRVFHDKSTDRIFVSIDSIQRIVLFGYDPKNKKMEKFMDSRNYYTSGKYPFISLDEDNDLMLTFKASDWKISNKYKLFWDESANWFGYKDVTPHWQAPPAPPAPEYTPPSYSSYQEPASEEIYYEDEEIVGS
ncbi:MAG: hypothetical protein PHQ44_00610 [Anaerovibrio sp.]|nr:hypothetical protein [Anaerovibrio sp.]